MHMQCVNDVLNRKLTNYNAVVRTTNSLVSLHSSLTHIMEPRAKQGIDILFPASVKYSLNLMTDEQTESTIERKKKGELK